MLCSPSRYPTPYPEANAVIDLLLCGVQAVLGECLVGLYLYGSLASGDFNPLASDIDFVVVTKDALADDQVEALQVMHARIWSVGPKLAGKLEGAYIPLRDLPRHNPQSGMCPTVNERQFFLARQACDWVIQRWILREQGVVVAGPPIGPLIEPVSSNDLRDSVLGYLREWWQPMLEHPARLESSEYQAYAVLSMCRALYTLRFGTIASKPVAAGWAQLEYEIPWSGLIECARCWKPGIELDTRDASMAWIRFVLEQAGIA